MITFEKIGSVLIVWEDHRIVTEYGELPNFKLPSYFGQLGSIEAHFGHVLEFRGEIIGICLSKGEFYMSSLSLTTKN